MTAPLDTAGLVALVEELRWQAPRLEKALLVEPPLTLDEANLMRRAADEIERLSALESRPVALADAHQKDTAKDSELAEARAALEHFAAANFFYADEPDDRVVSIGRWDRSFEPPRFNADLQTTVGAFRRARTVLSREASSNE